MSLGMKCAGHPKSERHAFKRDVVVREAYAASREDVVEFES
jgi:hypothetical protein